MVMVAAAEMPRDVGSEGGDSARVGSIGWVGGDVLSLNVVCVFDKVKRYKMKLWIENENDSERKYFVDISYLICTL